MKYVFYDAESVDKEHKCSFTFGYLVTDEKFNVIIPKEDIVFNPEIKTLEQAIDCFKQEDINKLFVEDLANIFEQTTQKETPNEQ